MHEGEGSLKFHITINYLFRVITIIFSHFQTGIIKSKKSPDADSNCDILSRSESPIINISHTKLCTVTYIFL